MEVFAVFGGRLSLYNKELQKDDPELNYVTLSVIFDYTKKFLDAEKDEYILYEARLDGILGVFPYDTITIIEKDGVEYNTVLCRMILNDGKNGFVVYKTEVNQLPVYKSKDPIDVDHLTSYTTISKAISQRGGDIEEVKCSLSRFDCPPTTG